MVAPSSSAAAHRHPARMTLARRAAPLHLALLLLALAPALARAAELEVLYQWNFLPFDLPKNFPADGYIPENNVFTGIEVGWNRLFVSVPRLRPGVAATLAWLPRGAAGSGASPNLQAYPNWLWHSADANCSGLISVYRVRADRCDRLWVLDSGLMDSLGTFTPVCEPKLLAFDLRSDRLVRSVVFPRDVRRLNSLFTNLVLDEGPGSHCDDMMVYISDTAGAGIVVYDVRRDATWRFGHASMLPHPDWTSIEVAGESFTLMDGIVGLALGPGGPPLQPGPGPGAAGARLLYFQPLASDRLLSVPTAALRAGPLPEGQELPVTLVGHKSSQSANLAADPRDGTVYFSPVRETAVAAYSPATRTTHVVAYDPLLLQFSSDLVIAPRDSGRFWLISSRFQRFFRRTYRPDEVNMRIMRLSAAPAAPRRLAPATAPSAPSAPAAPGLGPLPFASPTAAAHAYRLLNDTLSLFAL